MVCKTLFGGHTVLVRYNKEVVRSKKKNTHQPANPTGKKNRARERVRELTDTWWEHQSYRNARDQTSSIKHQTVGKAKLRMWEGKGIQRRERITGRRRKVRFTIAPSKFFFFLL